MNYYQDKKIFLQTLHPSAVIAYTAAVFFLALTFNHPLFLLMQYLLLCIIVKTVDAFQAYKKILLFSIVMLLMIVSFNMIFNRLGSTVLFSGPVLPVIGQPIFTLEAMVYGLTMSVRLLVFITVFFLYNQIINPDRALSFFAKFAPRSAMLLTLTTRLIPYLSVQLRNIKEVQQTRGIDFNSGGFVSGIKNYYPLLKVLLLSSLDNAFNIAEAIQSRGYGSGPRSCYTRENLQARDAVILAASGGAVFVGIVMLAVGWAQFQFYPQFGRLFASPLQPVFMLAVNLLLLTPVILSWGWRHWRYLKWRI